MTTAATSGGGCANIGLALGHASGERQWLLGSVSDDPYDFRTCVVVDRDGPLAYVATELRSAGNGDMAERGYVVTGGERARGVNEAGVALTWAFVDEQPGAARQSGVTSGAFNRYVLSSCASVADVLAFIENSERDFSGAWLFADATGALAQVEIARARYCVVQHRSADAGAFAVNVNCYQSEAMRPYEQASGSLDDLQAPNRARRDAAVSCVAGLENATIDDLAVALANHEGRELPGAEGSWVFPSQGFSICNHGHFPRDDSGTPAFGTVSAEIADPVTRSLWYCYGWPCGERAAFADQPFQDRSWGRFLPFELDRLPAGDMTTLTGELTATAAELVEVDRAREGGPGKTTAVRTDG